jgi:hypothetical protein
MMKGQLQLDEKMREKKNIFSLLHDKAGLSIKRFEMSCPGQNHCRMLLTPAAVAAMRTKNTAFS